MDLALNLFLEEDLLIEKAIGRRLCGECKENFNVAEIFRFRNKPGLPDINMPPLNPPNECRNKLIKREDDTEPIVRRRLEV